MGVQLEGATSRAGRFVLGSLSIIGFLLALATGATSPAGSGARVASRPAAATIAAAPPVPPRPASVEPLAVALPAEPAPAPASPVPVSTAAPEPPPPPAAPVETAAAEPRVDIRRFDAPPAQLAEVPDPPLDPVPALDTLPETVAEVPVVGPVVGSTIAPVLQPVVSLLGL